LHEGSELAKASLAKARDGGSVNYANLCERVNSLGTSLAQIKTDFAQLNREKEVNDASLF